MTLLILGVFLWIVAHLAKRIAPARRAKIGDQGKWILAIVIVVSVVLMVWGYSMADIAMLYSPLNGMGHLNNTLMLIAIYLFGVSGTKGVLFTRIRHPMLWGTAIWAVAHLAVNGDLASVILFGSMGGWALFSMKLINRSGPWVRPTTGRGLKGDLMNIAGTAVLYGLFAAAHIITGHNVFLGSY